ncbi:uncharacterized protein LOC121740029 [Aricia agestis]|uniref:uncharacterized protein LOC121740029 n=1 Tax=Aricia agestis TaxID=91739 RepID=UPI001C206507|nr:uncharacterized protein LOC121740029 [Aricia agestis]
MEPRTSRKDYKNHQYSGARKSRKRVRGQMKRHHGEVKSRNELWCKRPKLDDNDKKENISSSSILNNTVKTYITKSKKFNVEANYTQYEQLEKTENETTAAKPLDINWPLIDPTVNSHELTVEYVSPDNLTGLSGNRIVDLVHVLQWAFRLERHRSQCKGSSILFINELKDGFNSIFIFKCSSCLKEFRNSNEIVAKHNKAFVWGTLTAGSYYSQSAHITNLMDIPTMSPNKFRKTEKILGDVWQDHLTKEIKRNGELEKALALGKQHIDEDGVPFVTVYVDGGWPKRSYGHDYSSASGMACIIGKETKKCLFIGIKNKYCYHCHIYEKTNEPVPEHTCFRNYEGPSTGMESTILIEGFQKSQEMHGIKYLQFVGDGDSSVFAQLREKVSYGQQIKKIECKNHVIKNYTGALYKILANTKLPLLGRKILKPKVQKLTAVARKIIIHGDRNTFREDLNNGPSHVFGCHKDCKEYYCRFINSDEKDTDLSQELKTKAPTVWALICAAKEAVMSKCHRLSNDTTNVVENFMSVLSKFICGKRLNLHKGGSYQRRVYVAGLSHTAGENWHASAWKSHTACSPGKTVKKYIAQKGKCQERRKNYTRRRLFVPKCKPDQNYGPKAQEANEPIAETDLKEACLLKLKEFQKTDQEIEDIEHLTIGQHENDVYNTHRCNRLTASQFGMICKRKSTTPCHNHVKTILYKNNILTNDMSYGQRNESVARTLFTEKMKKNVRPAGLFIDKEFGFLGASPDGVIEEEKSILEIKCFPSLARNNQDMNAAAKDRKNFPLYIDNNGSLQINKKHNYYYQIQGQLRVSQMKKCYFVGYISPAHDITVLEIERDENFILDMLPKLVSFYKNSVLPEVVLRKVKNNQNCIDVSLW